MKYHFSVIIPTHNRQLALDRCLRSLKRQVYPPDRFEVIVVDDGSVHPVILDSDLFADGFTVSIMRIANSGPGPARNAGAAVAKGQFLAFTDDDCQPDPLWLLELERQLSADSCRIVGGKTHNMLTRNPCASTSQLIADMAYAYYNETPDSERFFLQPIILPCEPISLRRQVASRVAHSGSHRKTESSVTVGARWE